MQREVFGDSARGEEYAAVRLVVDGDRIVEADAPGIRRPLGGLTLLEAESGGGKTRLLVEIAQRNARRSSGDAATNRQAGTQTR